MRRRRQRRGGFTAIELIISLSLASIVTASTILATKRALGAYRSAQSTTHLDRDLRTAMDRIRWELMASGESVQYQLRFRPTSSAGAKTATMSLSHNAPNVPSAYQLTLTGNATN